MSFEILHAARWITYIVTVWLGKSTRIYNTISDWVATKPPNNKEHRNFPKVSYFVSFSLYLCCGLEFKIDLQHNVCFSVKNPDPWLYIYRAISIRGTSIMSRVWKRPLLIKIDMKLRYLGSSLEDTNGFIRFYDHNSWRDNDSKGTRYLDKCRVNLMPGVSRSDAPGWMSGHRVQFRVVDRGDFHRKSIIWKVVRSSAVKGLIKLSWIIPWIGKFVF